LAGVLERIHAAFLSSGLGEPFIQVTLADAPVPGFVSSVDRVVKRFPQLARFVHESAIVPNTPSIRHITNRPGCPNEGEPIELSTLLAIAAGVPRSFPFHNIGIRFHHAAFGEAPRMVGPAIMTPGVIVGDSWWVNGRSRSVVAVTIVEGDPTSKKLPSLPESVSMVFAACGKAKNTVQVPFVEEPQAARPNPEAARAVVEVVRDYRSRITEVLDRAALPHDLPPALEIMRATGLGEVTGPKKPVLLAAFKPMGYDCRGDSGTFTLRRRTSSNLSVELHLDVGTWSRSLTANFSVYGLGFSAVLHLPVSKRAGPGQYPIGDAVRWQKLVDNLAALVAELDRSFVPAVEAAAGPSPEWYRPSS
jgi:hypothetical protein